MLLISVVVTYNGTKWIDKCIGSLINSSIHSEIIVIDNCSIDGTPDIIRSKFPTVHIIENYENLGFGKANNIGIRKAYDAGADYVFLLNQDAWVDTDTIKLLIDAHQNAPDYGILSPIHMNGLGDALDRNFSVCISPNRCRKLYSDQWVGKLKDSPYDVHFVNAASWLISRKCISTVGGFNPVFNHYAEDDNYIHRVHFHKLKVGVYPHAYIYHDREDRPLDPFFHDNQVSHERNLILQLSNPNNSSVSKELLNKSILSLLFFAIKLRPKQFLSEWKKLNQLKRLILMTDGPLAISKQKGVEAFL
jgi:GT2 family glycosyltransferase